MKTGDDQVESFKPYYKWITFNTKDENISGLELKDGFKPYYKWITFNTKKLNLTKSVGNFGSFKPYYKWITFNT